MSNIQKVRVKEIFFFKLMIMTTKKKSEDTKGGIIGNPRLIPIRSSLSITYRNQPWVTDDAKEESAAVIQRSKEKEQKDKQCPQNTTQKTKYRVKRTPFKRRCFGMV